MFSGFAEPFFGNLLVCEKPIFVSGGNNSAIREREDMLAKKKIVLSVTIVMIALLITASILIIINRTSIYPYETDKNYEYPLDQTNARSISLNLKNGKITLPKKYSSYQTTFIKINVSTTLMGKYSLPSIEISSGKSSFIQYFEHGAKGSRYLNISALMSETETEINFKGDCISIDDQIVQLVTFENQDLSKLKVLVIAPHPDDAEIAAYGLYSSNKHSFVITVTAGEAGENKYDEIYKSKVKQYLKKGVLRTWNSITVPMLGGILPEQTLNLGFFDGTLETMFKNKSKPVKGLYTEALDIDTFRKQNISSLSQGLSGGADWNSLVENFEYLLTTIKPDVIVTPYPALDDHHDHKMTSIALFEAIKKLGIKSGDLYLYTNHLTLNEYYPYGKIGGIVSLPPNFEKTIYFDSIKSHTLSITNQQDKIFALEAMHDLRPDTEWRSSKGAIKNVFANIKRDIRGNGNSYYKRAIRSNELFFTVNIANIYDQEKLNRIIGKI
ncbi:MAG: N-acetylglucosaminylphosphatidylinositol deacetylase [Methylophaga sp.]|nr:MAG: N-acetylglucosaminylphosphatidylinositol deacetylase [Methylophaga sp.]